MTSLIAPKRFHLTDDSSPTGNAPNRAGTFCVWPLDGKGDVWPFRESPFEDYGTEFSPDVKWVAYTSDESGYEVYAEPSPSVGARER